MCRIKSRDCVVEIKKIFNSIGFFPQTQKILYLLVKTERIEREVEITKQISVIFPLFQCIMIRFFKKTILINKILLPRKLTAPIRPSFVALSALSRREDSGVIPSTLTFAHGHTSKTSP